MPKDNSTDRVSRLNAGNSLLRSGTQKQQVRLRMRESDGLRREKKLEAEFLFAGCYGIEVMPCAMAYLVNPATV
jgi:hypothetical protein